MAFRPFEQEHIATDPRHLKREPRYRVYEVATGATVATHQWAISAKRDAGARNIAAGACERCDGAGSVIVDYQPGPDGETAIGADCPTCVGTGRRGLTLSDDPA